MLVSLTLGSYQINPNFNNRTITSIEIAAALPDCLHSFGPSLNFGLLFFNFSSILFIWW